MISEREWERIGDRKEDERAAVTMWFFGINIIDRQLTKGNIKSYKKVRL